MLLMDAALHGTYRHGRLLVVESASICCLVCQVELAQLCLHTCSIVGAGGSFWPAPTFRIEATDRAQSIIEAKSPTGAWNAVLQRINLEIERRWALHCCRGCCSTVRDAPFPCCKPFHS